VRTGAATRSAEGIAALTLRTNDDGSALTIGDVARIVVGGSDRERAYFVGENPVSRSAWTGPRTATPSPSSGRSKASRRNWNRACPRARPST
jgi:hypothetical protein